MICHGNSEGFQSFFDMHNHCRSMKSCVAHQVSMSISCICHLPHRARNGARRSCNILFNYPRTTGVGRLPGEEAAGGHVEDQG
eukprot:52864-Eustigmatos_ZCMA.PRE.1